MAEERNERENEEKAIGNWKEKVENL